MDEIIVQTNESCCQKFFLKLCLNNGLPILFVGPTGTGKSAIVLDHMVSLSKDKYLANVINFSARTSSAMVSVSVTTQNWRVIRDRDSTEKALTNHIWF